MVSTTVRIIIGTKVRIRCPITFQPVDYNNKFKRLYRNSSSTSAIPKSSSKVINTTDNKTIRVLVVGSGIIGLRTAWELLSYNNNNNNNTIDSKQKIEIVLVSSRNPYDEKSCSVGAGGLWMPFRVADDNDNDKSTDNTDFTETDKKISNKVDNWAISTLDEYYPLGCDPNNDLVEIVPAVRLLTLEQQEELQVQPSSTAIPVTPGESQQKELLLPYWTNDRRINFQQLPIEMLCWQNTILQLRIPDQSTLLNANYTNAWLFYPPIINTYKMLQYLESNIVNHPNTIQVDYTKSPYNNLDEIINDAQKQYNCSVVVNCTGLGSKTICNDNSMIGVRGILHLYDRSNCPRIDNVRKCPIYGQTNTKDAVITVDSGTWCPTNDDVCYMIPKGNSILVGGTAKLCTTDSTMNDHSINENDYNQLRINAYNLGIDTNQIQSPINDWVGYRPYRTTSIRCEIDKQYSTNSISLYHNYGFGGSGWTLNVGAAKHITNLIRTKFFG
jgi:FAD dependent oxidoreductase